MKKQKVISSDDITDQYLTDKIFVAKIIRVSMNNKYITVIPFWKLFDFKRPKHSEWLTMDNFIY